MPDPFAVPASRVQLATTADMPSPARLLDDRIIAEDGAELPLRYWRPKSASPKAAIVALHGFNDYSNAFDYPGGELARAGYAVYAYDQRGFGEAPGRGFWPGEQRLAGDAATAVRLVHRRHPGIPVYLMGESMGGAVAILAETGAAGTPPARVDGIVLVAPAVWGRQTMNFFERTGLWVARQLPAMQLSQRSLPITVTPSDNIPMLRAYSRDPLVIKETRSDALNGLVDAMGAALSAAPKLDVPLLVLYGEHDEIVPRRPVARMVESLPPVLQAEQRVALYPQGYHMLFRDLAGETVVDDVVAWLGDHDAKLPSGFDRDARLLLTGSAPALGGVR